MAVMMGRLYAALCEANVPDEKATAAAEEAASFENSVVGLRNDFVGLRNEFAGHRNEFTALRGRVDLLTWMVGFNIAMTVALVGKIFLAR